MTASINQPSDAADRPGADRPSRRQESASAQRVAPEAKTLAFVPRQRRAAILARVVQSEILPRLMVARSAPADADPAQVTTEGDTETLMGLLLNGSAKECIAYVGALQARGATAASLYLGLVTAAARRLGEYWEEDRCGFAEVTIGLGHLQQVVRALSSSFQASAVARPHADTVLLVPAPGEQHTLGLVVLSEFFRREGWHVAGGPVTTATDAIRIVRDTWVDVAGFSIGSDRLLDALAACVAKVRQASRNKDIGIMVGGPMLLRYPDLAQRTGADTASADAPAAVREARALLSFRAAAD